eukprot:jgi/Hompol1/2018/HPOL_005818-RA
MTSVLVAEAATNKANQKHPLDKRVEETPTYFRPHPTELEESQRFEVVGEDLFDLAEDDLPCRELHDFTIYDSMNGNRVAPFEALEQSENNDIVASGVVKALPIDWDSDAQQLQRTDEDDDDEQDDGDEADLSSKGNQPTREKEEQRIRLSAIFYWELSHVESGNPIVWLRTEFAWYRLCQPSKLYEPIFKRFYDQLRLPSLIVKALSVNPQITLDQLITQHNNGELASMIVETSQHMHIYASATIDQHKIFPGDFVVFVSSRSSAHLSEPEIGQQNDQSDQSKDLAANDGKPDAQAFKIKGVLYRLFDFVYVVPSLSESNGTEPYLLGQIIQIQTARATSTAKPKAVSVELRMFERYDQIQCKPSHHDTDTVRDERHVLATSDTIVFLKRLKNVS